MAANNRPDWSKVFEKPGADGKLSQRWQWHNITGKYEQTLYPGVWMQPTAICPPPGMGIPKDAPCAALR